MPVQYMPRERTAGERIGESFESSMTDSLKMLSNYKMKSMIQQLQSNELRNLLGGFEQQPKQGMSPEMLQAEQQKMRGSDLLRQQQRPPTEQQMIARQFSQRDQLNPSDQQNPLHQLFPGQTDLPYEAMMQGLSKGAMPQEQGQEQAQQQAMLENLIDAQQQAKQQAKKSSTPASSTPQLDNEIKGLETQQQQLTYMDQNNPSVKRALTNVDKKITDAYKRRQDQLSKVSRGNAGKPKQFQARVIAKNKEINNTADKLHDFKTNIERLRESVIDHPNYFGSMGKLLFSSIPGEIGETVKEIDNRVASVLASSFGIKGAQGGRMIKMLYETLKEAKTSREQSGESVLENLEFYDKAADMVLEQSNDMAELEDKYPEGFPDNFENELTIKMNDRVKGFIKQMKDDHKEKKAASQVASKPKVGARRSFGGRAATWRDE